MPDSNLTAGDTPTDSSKTSLTENNLPQNGVESNKKSLKGLATERDLTAIKDINDLQNYFTSTINELQKQITTEQKTNRKLKAKIYEFDPKAATRIAKYDPLKTAGRSTKILANRYS